MADWQRYAVVGLLVALVLSAPLIRARLREYRLSLAGLENLDQMTDESMILHMARLFGALGYVVSPPNPDELAFDLMLTDGLGQKRGVLIRNWRSQIEAEVIALIASASKQLETASPMVVTVVRYTWNARQVAIENGAILWSLKELTDAIGRVRETAMTYPDLPSRLSMPVAVPEAPEGDAALSSEVPQEATGPTPQTRKRPERMRRGDGWSGTEVPKCPRCSRKMIARKGASGDYWGCPAFPRCLGTRPKS